MESLVASSFNFLLLVGILTYKLKSPVRQFVSSRHQTISEDLVSVRNQLKVAQEQHDEFSAKLKAVSAEIAALKEQSKREANEMKQRLISDARRSSALIVTDAQNSANALYSELKNHLYQELSTKVIDRAEEILRNRLTGDDRIRIQKEFSRQMEKVQ